MTENSRSLQLSIPYSFEPGFIEQIGTIKQVREIYGKLPFDWIGGGRSAYTLRPASWNDLIKSIQSAHRSGIHFNYLLNAAALYGLEQTRKGQMRIRHTLDSLMDAGVDAVTVSLPYLLTIIKKHYPSLSVRIGVFAQIDTAEKALIWEALGADCICLSAIACNRDFERLSEIRSAVKCNLQLIANAACTPQCAWENTHMHLLSQSSAKGVQNRGFVIDYCFVNCTMRRLHDRAAYIKSIWIRPEDLPIYHQLGYFNFKLVERSSPVQLTFRRAKAYAEGKFDGNLWELIAPVAMIKKEQGISWRQRLHMFSLAIRPRIVPIHSILEIKRFAQQVIPHEFAKGIAPVYIDNRSLNGFLKHLPQKNCRQAICARCGYCREWAEKTVIIDKNWENRVTEMGNILQQRFTDSSFWGKVARSA
jgi:collagenase-like PrtC family protease